MSTIFVDAVARQHQADLRHEAENDRAARTARRRTRRAARSRTEATNDYGAGGVRRAYVHHGPIRHSEHHHLRNAWTWLRTAEL